MSFNNQGTVIEYHWNLWLILENEWNNKLLHLLPICIVSRSSNMQIIGKIQLEKKPTSLVWIFFFLTLLLYCKCLADL